MKKICVLLLLISVCCC